MARVVINVMDVLTTQWGNLDSTEGVVLVDELGEHLHPQWQMGITDALRRTFPRVQFIASTHHPLCLRGLRDGEVIVLREGTRGIFALTDLPPVEGLSVNQILMSEHFGLDSTIDPDIERLFERYRTLMVRKPVSPDEASELQLVRARLNELRQLGNTVRERLAFEAADRFLALARDVGDQAQHVRLKNETREVIAAIWARPLPDDASH